MCTPSQDPHQKLLDYQMTLAFIQDELLADRKKLEQAKKDGAPEEIISMIEKDIETMEMGADRYQAWVILLKKNLDKNES